MANYKNNLSDCLEGFRVIELASVLAGPSVGMFLAELGADLTKIENPNNGGDVTRSWKLAKESAEESRSAYFCSVNWGKRSLQLDLKKDDDLKSLFEMLDKADILITSFKKGDEHKFKLEPERILKDYPGLIYASIIGYHGDDHRVAYDAAVQAESGWWYLNGERNSEGHKLPVAVVDVFAGHQLKQGILAAVIKKMKTGLGSFVEVSLFDSAISALVNQASNWLVAGMDPEPMGSEHPNISPYGNVFTCADNEKIMLAIGTNKQFKKLCSVLDVDLDASLFGRNEARVANRDLLKVALEEAILKRNSLDFLNSLRKQKVPCAKVVRVSEALNNVGDHLILEDQGIRGIRQAVFTSDRRLNAPPIFKRNKI